jgi:crossover junction endodeoxyribonuclease RuvC
MRILGIDPGLQTTGFGLVDCEGAQLHYAASGTIRTADAARGDLPGRLKIIFEGVREIVERYQPAQASVEIVFVNVNPQSTLLLGQARGAALAALVSGAQGAGAGDGDAAAQAARAAGQGRGRCAGPGDRACACGALVRRDGAGHHAAAQGARAVQARQDVLSPRQASAHRQCRIRDGQSQVAVEALQRRLREIARSSVLHEPDQRRHAPALGPRSGFVAGALLRPRQGFVREEAFVRVRRVGLADRQAGLGM